MSVLSCKEDAEKLCSVLERSKAAPGCYEEAKPFNSSVGWKIEFNDANEWFSYPSSFEEDARLFEGIFLNALVNLDQDPVTKSTKEECSLECKDLQPLVGPNLLDLLAKALIELEGKNA